jgi:hypothetical protein
MGLSGGGVPPPSASIEAVTAISLKPHKKGAIAAPFFFGPTVVGRAAYSSR